VTGTFDDWSKSEKLEKKGDTFIKDVILKSADEKIYYKVRERNNSARSTTSPRIFENVQYRS
jgi:hypothetical protein